MNEAQVAPGAVFQAARLRCFSTFWTGVRAILLCLLLDVGVAAQDVTVRKDVSYKSGEALSEYETTRCKLDVYAPARGKDLPCLIWFHGGGLTEGDKGGKEMVAACRALSAEGMVVVAINYRLSPRTPFPGYVEDAAAAIAWTKEHAAELGGSSGKLFVAGHSAGAYLAALVSLDERFLQKHGIPLGELKGVIPIAGQAVTHYAVRKERGIPRSRIIVDEAAPLYHVKKDSPPFLVLYAEKDMALRKEECTYLAAALFASGNNGVSIMEMPGHDHGGVGNRIGEPESPVRAEMMRFIRGLADGAAPSGSKP